MNRCLLLSTAALEIVFMLAPYHCYFQETLRFLLSNSIVRHTNETVILLARLKPREQKSFLHKATDLSFYARFPAG
jgi:hypothetical protein